MYSPASSPQKRIRKPRDLAIAKWWHPRKSRISACIPDLDPKEFRPDADYFHICMNNTIYGTVFHALPETGDVPLVADISSCILSRPIDVS